MDEKTRDVYLSRGIVLLGGVIDKAEAVEVMARIEYISQHNPGGEVKLLINSPGGVARYSLAIHDELKKLGVPVATGCAGMADGSAAMLLAAGTKGRRGALEHAVVHAADIWSAKEGAPSVEELEGIEKLRERFTEIWVESTGQSEDAVREWMNSQRRFTAGEAVEAGIIDFVVSEDWKSGGEDGDILGLFRD